VRPTSSRSGWACGDRGERDGQIKVDDYGQTNPKASRSPTWSAARRSPTRPARKPWSRSSAPSAWTPIRSTRVVSATFTQPAGREHRPQRGTGQGGSATRRQKLSAVGAGVAYDDRDGLVNFVVDARTGKIVGADIVGNRVCDMITEVVGTMALEGGYQELERIVHPHRLLGGDPRRGPGDRRLGDPRLVGPARSARCWIHSRPRRSRSRRMARRLPGRRTDRLPNARTRLASSALRRASCREPGVDRGVRAGLLRRADRA
jgi:hypothetical protein